MVLLNFGQSWNLIWWWQVNHILAPILASVLLVFIVLKGMRPRFRYAVLTGICLVLLTLSGPGGLPYALALAPWLGYWSFSRYSMRPHGKRESLIVSGLATVVVLLVALYFVGIDPSQVAVLEQPPNLEESLKGFIQILSLSLGTATKPFWPLSGLGVLVVSLISAAVLVRTWCRRPQERFRVLGILLFMGAAGMLALSVGWGRAPSGLDYIFGGHLLTLGVPLLCCVYLVLGMYCTATAGGFIPDLPIYCDVFILCS
jgi:hypothetical protein